MINANTNLIKLLKDDKRLFIFYKVLEVYFETDYHKYLSFWDFSEKINNTLCERTLENFKSLDDLKELLKC